MTPMNKVPAQIASSYGVPLAALEMGWAPLDVIQALTNLVAEVPKLRITELWRSPHRQDDARKKYERWLNAGKPSRGSIDFIPEGMKTDFVARPGKSMHNAGRAIDVDVNSLQETFGQEYLDAFWPIAKRHGWTPIISKPLEGVSESWHFDHWGPWLVVRDRLGYEQGALAASLAVGKAGQWQNDIRRAQAHIIRLGYDIGEIDGVAGKRTVAAETAILGANKISAFQFDYKLIADELERL